MPHIAIVGAGVAGLHLGLHLLQQGKEVTIFTNRTAQDVFDGRIMNSVSHMHVTQAIENQLGIGDWPDVDGYYYRHYHYNGWGEDREFYGDFTMPSRVIDYRIYLPRLMREFEKRGGELIIRELDRPGIEALTEQYDLVVVSTGKGEIGAMFPKREDKSPYGKPQRHLTLSLWHGVRELDPAGVAINIVPGVGELLVIPIWSHAGRVSALLFESVPGGPQDVLNSKKQHEDPEGFRERILNVLETHYPPVFDRVDHDKFELTSDKDVLQGAFAPSLREDYIQLPNGKFLLALGDVHLTLDPVTAQGGNAAANSAKDTAAVFAEDDVYDEHFLRKVARRRAERVEGANDWVNMMIATPGHERIGQFFTAMAHDKALTDEFTENFNYPTRQLDLLSSQERVNARTSEILQAASQPA